MPREEYRELSEFERIHAAVLGPFFALGCLQMMSVGLATSFKEGVGLVAILAFAPIYASMSLDPRSRFIKRLIVRNARALPYDAKHGVKLTLKRNKRTVLNDFGVLSLHDGLFRFEGVECQFAIPLTLANRPFEERHGFEVSIDGAAYELWVDEFLIFDEAKTLSSGLRAFSLGESKGELSPPPTEPCPPIPLWKRPGFPLIVFWSVVGVVGVFQSRLLMARGLVEPRHQLIQVFALTVLAALTLALVQFVKLWRATR